jgi:hypothetical protein
MQVFVQPVKPPSTAARFGMPSGYEPQNIMPPHKMTSRHLPPRCILPQLNPSQGHKSARSRPSPATLALICLAHAQPLTTAACCLMKTNCTNGSTSHHWQSRAQPWSQQCVQAQARAASDLGETPDTTCPLAGAHSHWPQPQQPRFNELIKLSDEASQPSNSHSSWQSKAQMSRLHKPAPLEFATRPLLADEPASAVVVRPHVL